MGQDCERGVIGVEKNDFGGETRGEAGPSLSVGSLSSPDMGFVMAPRERS